MQKNNGHIYSSVGIDGKDGSVHVLTSKKMNLKTIRKFKSKVRRADHTKELVRGKLDRLFISKKAYKQLCSDIEKVTDEAVLREIFLDHATKIHRVCGVNIRTVI